MESKSQHHRRRAALACLILGLLCVQTNAAAQATPREHRASGWVGFMSDWELPGPLSIWFDTHYNNDAFMVLRGGLTHSFEGGPRLTAGYAHLWTNPGDGTLERNEHRPWGQVFLPFTFSNRWSVSQRLRFDLRVQERVANNQVVRGWGVTPRLRTQTAISYWLKQRTVGRWFFQTAAEVLVNSGREAGPNYLDQTRLSAMLGWSFDVFSVRTGYLDRFVPGASGLTPVHEHNAVLWLNYRFSSAAPDTAAISSPEGGNP